jgi:two-component system, NtrC family, response regulator
MARVLIIDDDESICAILSQMVMKSGHDAVSAYSIDEGLKALSSGTFDVVFLDVQLPDGNGLDLLPKIVATPSEPEVIIITGRGSPDGAELAIKNGAWDYIEKPSSMQEMILPFVRALQYREEKKSMKPPVALKREMIIGTSPQMRACLDILAQSASSEAHVLISGETGTGKELFAKAVHENSPRRNNNYVVVDCAALPKTLVESMLFGHKKGAFTGAGKDSDGLIKHADNGTILLDEVGELPLDVQRTFLRVLQEKRFRPVGGSQEVSSDFRVLSSTNRDLDKMVQQGRFRNDLLFRLRTFHIKLPTLKERREDIKDLAIHYMVKLCESYGLGTKGFSPEFLEAIMNYSWPGNVRELVHTMERIISVAKTQPTLYPKHLPEHIRIALARGKKFNRSQPVGTPKEIGLTSPTFPKLRDYREREVVQIERQYLNDLMAHTKGNAKEACKLSGLGKSRFYELLRKYDYGGSINRRNLKKG